MDVDVWAIISAVIVWLVTSAACFLLFLLLWLLVIALWEWWQDVRWRRIAEAKDRAEARAEAELDRAEQELYDTIRRLAEALAEERVAAEMTRRRMAQIVRREG